MYITFVCKTQFQVKKINISRKEREKKHASKLIK